VSEGGQVSRRGLAPLEVMQVLFGIQQCTRGGAKITEVNLRHVKPEGGGEQGAGGLQVAACPTW
jgi:hypothetical protein